MKVHLSILALGLLLAWPAPGPGQEREIAQDTSEAAGDPAQEPGASLRVSLLTMGPGDAVWEQFSHNAILIQDLSEGWARAYNWGVFDFDQVDFIPRLIRGTMLYMMAPYDAGRAIEEYRRNNRAVWAQELALTPRQRADLLAFVEWNARPENRNYRYDYYRDNCSTRVRDALDRVLAGRIRAETEADTTTHTYRWHTRRLLQRVPAAYVGIQLVLGASADRPLTTWEEMFLPIRLMEEIRGVQVPDGSGGMAPLVVRESQLLEARRPPIPTRPPFALPWFLLPGVVWGGGILLLSRRSQAARRRGDAPAWVLRTGLSALAGGWILAATGSGLLLLGAWLFSDHVFWYRNLNLLQANPLFLLLLPAFAPYLLRGRFPTWGRDLAAALAVISLVGFFMSLLPGLGQENGEILALTIPVNLSLALGAAGLAPEGHRYRRGASEAAAPAGPASGPS